MRFQSAFELQYIKLTVTIFYTVLLHRQFDLKFFISKALQKYENQTATSIFVLLQLKTYIKSLNMESAVFSITKNFFLSWIYLVMYYIVELQTKIFPIDTISG